MKKFVVITTSFPATHNWPSCNIPEVYYLASAHRHVFHVTMKFKIKHMDRDVEFISEKMKIDSFISEKYRDKHLKEKSCEMISWELMEKFNADFVSVFEDGENGAEIYKD